MQSQTENRNIRILSHRLFVAKHCPRIGRMPVRSLSYVGDVEYSTPEEIAYGTLRTLPNHVPEVIEDH